MQASPVVAVTGPRRAGKATLARREFPGHRYVNLDDTADRLRARRDPQAFLGALRGWAVIDQAHRAPELALALPATGRPGQLLLLAPVRLAWGQVPELHLFPLSLAEREGRPPRTLETLARYRPALAAPQTALASLLGGAAPDQRLLEEDLRALSGFDDADRFHTFAALAAQASGEGIDLSACARQTGVTHTTIARWLQALERAFQLVLVPPWPAATGRRMVRRRKLYFLEPGAVPPPRRFAAWCTSEIVKTLAHTAAEIRLFHWQTATGLTADLVLEGAGGPVAVRFQPLPAVPPAAITALAKWRRPDPDHAALLLHAGATASERQGIFCAPWHAL